MFRKSGDFMLSGARVRGYEGMTVRGYDGARVRWCDGTTVRRCDGSKEYRILLIRKILFLHYRANS